jgi:DNA-binding MarR family transcriptional regulator
MSATRSGDLLALDNQLCFALYAATRAITRTYRERLEPLGLTYPQYLALTVLWETDGLTVGDMGRRLMLDSGTLTPLLKRLEGAGIIRRSRRTSDEREVEIWLTEDGARLKEMAYAVREHVVCRLGMSEREIAALRRELMALVEQLGHELETVPAT